MKSVLIIGSGISSLSAASCLAEKGYKVTILEKHDQPGGRIRMVQEKGFKFDLGPSWYWMPDVFERFFNKFGKTTADFYDLIRLDPSYQVIFEEDKTLQISADFKEIKKMFESEEQGAAKSLDVFMDDAQFKYEQSMDRLVRKPSLSFMEFAEWSVIKNVFKIDLFSPISKGINKLFKNKALKQLLEFPVLFLGAKPTEIPALYSLMNYADFKLGTWYPKGGMVQISRGFTKLAEGLGANILLNKDVAEIVCEKDKVIGVKTTSGELIKADVVLSGADYAFTETLLPIESRNYSYDYWEAQTFAPSSLIFYLGVNKRIAKLKHHNLFFDTDFEKHAETIYDTHEWPDKPLFYVCAPSVTEDDVAPKDCENLFVLIPISTDLKDSEEVHDKLYHEVLERLEKYVGEEIRPYVDVKKHFSVKDFKSEYNSFGGNAYGLANTLKQTAFFKPKMKNKHLKNMYYTGQLTVPGPGVPPSIISGEIVADLIQKEN
jgi:phytoene desaturase